MTTHDFADLCFAIFTVMTLVAFFIQTRRIVLLNQYQDGMYISGS